MDEPDTWPDGKEQTQNEPNTEADKQHKEAEKPFKVEKLELPVTPRDKLEAEKENFVDTMDISTDRTLREEVKKCYRSILEAEEATVECERTHDNVRKALYKDVSRDSSFYGGRLDFSSPRLNLSKFSRSETSLEQLTKRPRTTESPRRYRRMEDTLLDLDRTPPSSMWRPRSYNRYNRYERSNVPLRPPSITVTDTSRSDLLAPRHQIKDFTLRVDAGSYNTSSLRSTDSSLFRSGSSVNLQDEEGRIPLHNAAIQGKIVTLQDLIREGAIVNAVDNYGKSPLSYAVENGYSSIARELIYHGAYVNQKDRNGRTPLIVATIDGRKTLVDLLLRSGGSVFIADKDLKAPVHYAAENNHPSIMEELLRFGAPINQSDGDQKKPIHIASENGYLFVLELLLRKGANVDALERNMQTPLFLSVLYGLEFIVHTLLKSGASPNSCDRIRQTPLHLAAGGGHFTIASDLLLHYARTESRDEKGKSPIFYAVEAKDIKMVDLLLRNGAHVDVSDQRGQTLLSYAVDTKSDDMIHLIARRELKTNSNRYVLLKQLQIAIIQNSDFLGRTVWNHLLDQCYSVLHDPVETRSLESTVKILLDLTVKSFQKSAGVKTWKTEPELQDGKITKPRIIAFVDTIPLNSRKSFMGVPVMYRSLLETSLDDPTDVSLGFDLQKKYTSEQ